MVDIDLLSSYAGLLGLATVSIYVGAFGSLPNPPREPNADASPRSLLEDDDDDEDDVPERMSSEEAWLFPIGGSGALFGLYMLVQRFGKEWINYLLGWYFALAGVGSVWKSLISVTRFCLGDKRWKKFEKTKVLVLKGPLELLAISFRTPSILLFPVALIPSALYTFSTTSRKSVILTDLLAISFSHNSLAMLKLDSFKTGVILLSGLFAYDIWWVFGTEVMVSVAKNLDVPIKLLWPKSTSFSGSRGFTMLGLGDIVIPGVFVALALRYDYDRHIRSAPKGRAAASFSKPYFYAAMSAYILGLTTTMTVMHVFKAAQPALLYLSPACILSFFLTATLRGELKSAWTWSDEPEEAPEITAEAKPLPYDAAPTPAQPSEQEQTQTLAVPVVDEKADTEAEVSEAEGKPKKKKSKKKTA